MSSGDIWWWTWQAPSQANTLPTSPCRSPSRISGSTISRYSFGWNRCGSGGGRYIRFVFSATW